MRKIPTQVTPILESNRIERETVNDPHKNESKVRENHSNTSSESPLHSVIVHRLEKKLGYDPQAHMRARAEIWDVNDYYDPGSLKDQIKEQLGLTHTSSESESDSDSDSDFEP